MDYAGFPAALVFDLKKESPFSFKCQVCSACCSNKAIRVSPYEALRLSRNLGLSTTAFYQRYTEEGTNVLRNKADGTCFFLSSGGCGVHPDRPLVCRLFPLGQITDKEGRTRYAVMPFHPDCLGYLDKDGTVESYLASQEVEPYLRYDAVYERVYKKLLKKLEDTRPAGAALDSSTERGGAKSGSLPSPGLLSIWLDIDKTVMAYCQKIRRAAPRSIAEAVSIHIEAIERWLDSL